MIDDIIYLENAYSYRTHMSGFTYTSTDALESVTIYSMNYARINSACIVGIMHRDSKPHYRSPINITTCKTCGQMVPGTFTGVSQLMKNME